MQDKPTPKDAPPMPPQAAAPDMRAFPRQFGNQTAVPFHQTEYLALKKSIVDECRSIDFKASRLLDCISGDLLLRLMATVELMADGNRDIMKLAGEQSAMIGGRLELEPLTLA